MNTEVLSLIRRYRMFPPGSLVLCGVSGGADSVSLLHILLAMQKELDICLAAAHYNHGLRQNAGRDEKFVQTLCRQWDVPLYIGHGDVSAAAQAAGESVELTARRLRYAFLKRVAGEIGANVIATAHTADDNMETVLMNLSRGAGAAGASGIPPVRGHIVRPMLAVTRHQVEQYAQQHGLEYMQDETNQLDIYARNRVRHQAVPVLRQLNPRAAEHFFQTSELLRADDELLQAIARAELTDKAERTPRGISLQAAVLGAAPEPLAARCLLTLCRELGLEGLTAAKVEAVLQLARSGSVSGELDLGGGILAWRSYDRLFIGPGPASGFSPRVLEPQSETEIPEIGLRLRCRIRESCERIHNSFLFFAVGCDTIQGCLVVRPRQAGDSIRLTGRPEKTLKKLFIEQKIPKRQRQTIPVIADDAGVIAVVGFGCDERRKTDHGPVLEIEVQYGGSADE